MAVIRNSPSSPSSPFRRKQQLAGSFLWVSFFAGALYAMASLMNDGKTEDYYTLMQYAQNSDIASSSATTTGSQLIDQLIGQQQRSAATSTFPLVLGDPTLTPINLLESNFTVDKQHCDTYHAPNKRDFICHIEWDEWMTSKAFVRPGDGVMEFGGRYGTTACILSRSVGPTGAVVTVEPDRSVQGHLLYNRHAHQCGFHALLGTVSSKPLFIKESGLKGYGTQTTTSGEPGWASIPNMELKAVEQIIGQKINVALIDCEGCVSSVNETGLLDQVDLILLEEDGGIVYSEWHESFAKRGFDCLWYLKDTADPSRKSWAAVRHSVWLRKGANRQYPSCEDYAQETGLSATPSLFMCATCPELP